MDHDFLHDDPHHHRGSDGGEGVSAAQLEEVSQLGGVSALGTSGAERCTGSDRASSPGPGEKGAGTPAGSADCVGDPEPASVVAGVAVEASDDECSLGFGYVRIVHSWRARFRKFADHCTYAFI